MVVGWHCRTVTTMTASHLGWREPIVTTLTTWNFALNRVIQERGSKVPTM